MSELKKDFELMAKGCFKELIENRVRSDYVGKLIGIYLGQFNRYETELRDSKTFNRGIGKNRLHRIKKEMDELEFNLNALKQLDKEYLEKERNMFKAIGELYNRYSDLNPIQDKADQEQSPINKEGENSE